MKKSFRYLEDVSFFFTFVRSTTCKALHHTFLPLTWLLFSLCRHFLASTLQSPLFLSKRPLLHHKHKSVFGGAALHLELFLLGCGSGAGRSRGRRKLAWDVHGGRGWRERLAGGETNASIYPVEDEGGDDYPRPVTPRREVVREGGTRGRMLRGWDGGRLEQGKGRVARHCCLS